MRSGLTHDNEWILSILASGECQNENVSSAERNKKQYCLCGVIGGLFYSSYKLGGDICLIT